MKNQFIIPSIIIATSIIVGFWMVKPPSEPQKVIVIQKPDISIHEAAYRGNIKAVKQHLDAGADVNAKLKGGETPLDLASLHPETADLLRKHGGKTGEELRSIDLLREHEAKTGEEWKAAKQGPKPKAPRISIHEAAGAENIKAVKQHIAAGTDLNAKNKSGDTPLVYAAWRGHAEIAEMFIAEGADVNAMNNYGRTPLDWATENERYEVTQILRKHGGKTGDELKAEEK